MIKEITELHHGKSTNPDIPVAAALHVLILPCSNGGLGSFEIPGLVHTLMDVRVQLIMSEHVYSDKGQVG